MQSIKGNILQKTLLLFLTLLALYLPISHPEIIKFKTGQSLKVKIVEKKSDHIKADVSGVIITYYLDDIAVIDKEPLDQKPDIEKRITHKITKKYTLKAIADVYSLKFCLPLPRKDILDQEISDLKTFPKANAQIKDADGNDIVVFYFSNVKAGTTLIAGADYTVSLKQPRRTMLPSETKENYTESDKGLDPYLISEKALNPDNPYIKNTSDSIIGLQKTPYQKCKAIYDYMTSSFVYDHEKRTRRLTHTQDRDDGIQKPEITLAQKTGVCSDFSTLFVALARANKIPARMVSGVVFDPQEKTNTCVTNEGHAWVEVYLPEFGWFAIDPTYGINQSDAYFGIGSGTHISEAYGQLYTKEFGSLDKGWAMEVRTLERGGQYPIICDMETRLERITK